MLTSKGSYGGGENKTVIAFSGTLRPDSSSSKDSRLHKRIALERKRYYNASVHLARISVARAAALALYSRLTNRWNVC